MTLDQEYHKVSCKLAKLVHDKYMVEAYQLRACSSSSTCKTDIEKLKLRIDFTSYGLSCYHLNKEVERCLEPLDFSCLPEMGEDDPTLDTGCICSFIHVQEVASDQWIVEHNLGYHPSVNTTVILEDGTKQEINGVVTYAADANQLTIDFSEPFAGIAYLS